MTDLSRRARVVRRPVVRLGCNYLRLEPRPVHKGSILSGSLDSEFPARVRDAIYHSLLS